jgi:hypothetical protein
VLLEYEKDKNTHMPLREKIALAAAVTAQEDDEVRTQDRTVKFMRFTLSLPSPKASFSPMDGCPRWPFGEHNADYGRIPNDYKVEKERGKALVRGRGPLCGPISGRGTRSEAVLRAEAPMQAVP